MSHRDALHPMDDLASLLAQLNPQAEVSTQLAEILRLGLDKLPQPASGRTLQRWQALARVAAHDLSLAKLYEGHTDALAILAEVSEPNALNASSSPGAWGMWAAEAANARVTITPHHGTAVFLDGTKCWCSGANTAGNGLLTAWHADGRGPQLVRVGMRQPGVSVSATAWQAVGMAGSASLDVSFSHADAHLVGGEGDYLSRPGFWQGGAGVAACWYGGALGLASTLRQAMIELPQAARGAFKLAALGKVDLALYRTAVLLRDAAQWIDDNPLGNASAVALRARLAAEACAKTVLDEVGRALGAGVFCRNAYFAKAAADLPVFVRQSHAERDFSALGERLMLAAASPWPL